MKRNINASRIVELVFLFLIVCSLLVLVIGNITQTNKEFIFISLGVCSTGLAAFQLLQLWFRFEDKNNASKPNLD
jgi:competence protein ComGC